MLQIIKFTNHNSKIYHLKIKKKGCGQYHEEIPSVNG
jgi:hypothetical protein